MKVPAGIRTMSVIALFLVCIAAPTLASSHAVACDETAPKVPLA